MNLKLKSNYMSKALNFEYENNDDLFMKKLMKQEVIENVTKWSSSS